MSYLLIAEASLRPRPSSPPRCTAASTQRGRRWKSRDGGAEHTSYIETVDRSATQRKAAARVCVSLYPLSRRHPERNGVSRASSSLRYSVRRDPTRARACVNTGRFSVYPGGALSLYPAAGYTEMVLFSSTEMGGFYRISQKCSELSTSSRNYGLLLSAAGGSI